MWAKQSTAATLIVGPILDSSGAEYASAVIGDLSISKNGGTLTALAAAASLTHIANGQYTLVLTTGNLDTLGRTQITCNKSTYQMPPIGLVVVPAMVFDSLVLGTDVLQSDVTQFGGTNGTFTSGKPDVQAAASVSGAVGSVTGSVGSVVGNLGGNVNGNVVGSVASVAGNVSGSVGSVSGAVGSVTGSVGSVVGSVGGSVASVSGAVGSVSGNVGGDVAGKVLGGGSGTISGDGVRAASVTGAVGSVTGSVGSVVGAVELDSASVNAVADQVWDESYADHNGAGSFGKLLNTIRKANLAIEGTVTNAASPAATGFTSNVSATTGAYEHAVLLFTSGSLAGENSPIITYTSTNGAIVLEEALTAAPAVNDEFVIIAGSHVHSVASIKSGLSTLTAADVNAEVVDALSVDTYAELSAPPAATSSLKDKITWLFMYARNKITQTSSQRKLYRDDGSTVAGTSGTSDDGTTFTKGEDA